MIYLAQSYSQNPNEAYELAKQLSSEALEAGYDIFSPILHFHPLAEYHGLDNRSHSFWIRKCLPFLNMCDAAIFIHTAGWHQSKGMEMERAFCLEVGKPTGFVEETKLFTNELGLLFVKVAHLQPHFDEE